MSALARLILATLIVMPLGAAPAMARQEGGPQRADIEFAGGPVSLYLGLLRSTYDEANIVATSDASEVQVTPIILMGTTLHDAVGALQWASGESGRRLLVGREGGLLSVYLPGEESRRAQERTHVWTVASILESGYEADDLLSAVDTALGLTSDPATVRFHEGADLLIVNANEEQLSTIDQIVSRLDDAASFRLERQAVEDLIINYNAAKVQVEELKNERSQLISEIQALEFTVARLRDQQGQP